MTHLSLRRNARRRNVFQDIKFTSRAATARSQQQAVGLGAELSLRATLTEREASREAIKRGVPTAQPRLVIPRDVKPSDLDAGPTDAERAQETRDTAAVLRQRPNTVVPTATPTPLISEFDKELQKSLNRSAARKAQLEERSRQFTEEGRVNLLGVATSLVTTFADPALEGLIQLSEGGTVSADPEGLIELKQEFEERPLPAQILLSLIEPQRAVAGSAVAIPAMTNLAWKKGLRPLLNPTERRVRRDVARVEEKLALERIAKQIDVAQYPAYDDILKLQDARTALSGGPFDVVGRVRRFWDPSSELRRVDLDADTRKVLEASFVNLNMDKMRNGFVTDLMARVATRGDIKKLFGDAIDVDDIARGGRATRVTEFADGTSTGGKEFFGNVFENRAKYRLTDEQTDFIDFQHNLFDDILKYAQAEGVDIRELGRLDDAFFYFPRFVEDAAKKRGFDGLLDQRTGNPLKKSRLNDLMTEDVIKNGGRYLGPTEAARSYFNAVYHEIARVRTLRELKGLSRTRKVAKNILMNASKATTRVRSMDLMIRDVQKMKQGFFPSGATRAAWGRQFDGLKSQINDVMTLRPTDIDTLINGVSRKTMQAVGSTNVAKFGRALLRLQNEAPALGAEVLRGLDTRQQGLAQEFIDKAHNVRSAERRVEREFGPASTEQDILLREGKNLEFSRSRGYTESEITELDEFRKLTEQVSDFVDPQDLELSVPGVGRTRKRPSYKDIDHDLIKAAIRSVGVEGEKAALLEREAIKAGEALLTGERGREIERLLGRMEDARGVARDARTEMIRVARDAKTRARTPGRGESVARSVSEQEIFPEETARLIERHFKRDDGNAFIRAASNFSATVRTIGTTIDFGAPLLLGLPKLFQDPTAWAKATALHIRAFGNSTVRARYITRNHEEFIDFVKHGGGVGSTEWMESLQAGGWLAALPIAIRNSGLPSTVSTVLAAGPQTFNVVARRFNSSFETFLDVAKIETWKGLRGTAKNERELRELATFTNQLLGSADPRALGVRTTQREFENAVMFYAPRYFRATAGLMMDVMRGGMRGRQARNTVASLMFGIAISHVAAATALGQEPQLNPTIKDPLTGKVRANPNFMKVEVAGQNVGFGTKYLSWSRTLIRLAATAAEKPETFVTWENWDPSNAAAYRENPALAAIRNQGSALTSNVVSVITGADQRGRALSFDEPVQLAGQVLEQNSLSFWMQAALEGEAAERRRSGADFFSTQALPQRAGSAATGAGAEFVGLFTYPIATYGKLNDLYDEYARKDFKKSWDEIRRDSRTAGQDEKRLLLNAHDDLRSMQNIYNKEQREQKVNEERTQVDNKLDANTRTWVGEILSATRVYDDPSNPRGIQAGFELKTSIRDATIKRRSANDQLERDFPGIFERREEYRAELAENFPLIAAQNEFFDRVSGYTTDDPPGVIIEETNKVNYRALDVLRADIDATYGTGTMAEISQILREKRLDLRDHAGNAIEFPDTYHELVESYELTRPYWEAYKGVVPEKDWDTWLDFDDASDKRDFSGFSDQQRLQRANPALIDYQQSVERERVLIRRESREIDSALLLFSGLTTQNVENYDALIKQIQSIVGP